MCLGQQRQFDPKRKNFFCSFESENCLYLQDKGVFKYERFKRFFIDIKVIEVRYRQKALKCKGKFF